MKLRSDICDIVLQITGVELVAFTFFRLHFFKRTHSWNLCSSISDSLDRLSFYFLFWCFYELDHSTIGVQQVDFIYSHWFICTSFKAICRLFDSESNFCGPIAFYHLIWSHARDLIINSWLACTMILNGNFNSHFFFANFFFPIT